MSNLSFMTRNEIASFVGNDPRAIKAIENIIRSINTVQTSQIKSDRVLLWLSM